MQELREKISQLESGHLSLHRGQSELSGILKGVLQGLDALREGQGKQTELFIQLIELNQKHIALSDRTQKIEDKLDDVIFPSMAECERHTASMRTWMRAIAVFFAVSQVVVGCAIDTGRQALGEIRQASIDVRDLKTKVEHLERKP